MKEKNSISFESKLVRAREIKQ